ncbi:MAG TPA: hypothetical protein VMG40_17405 [Bryobacteraceae bacterium]|jgi:hypothetical protein|nr:hypothetical protein [Bryobacteraceae bacterium]
MTRATVGRKREPPRHHAVAKVEKDGLALVDTYLPAGSTERKVATVGGAAIGALLAAALLGVGPAALAGAAGYLVYHDTAR